MRIQDEGEDARIGTRLCKIHNFLKFPLLMLHEHFLSLMVKVSLKLGPFRQNLSHKIPKNIVDQIFAQKMLNTGLKSSQK